MQFIDRLLCFFLLLVTASLSAQTHEFLISDTAFVKIYYDIESDSTISLNRNVPHIGKIIVYYDSAHLSKAYEIEYKSTWIYSSSQWFSNGQLHAVQNRFGTVLSEYEGKEWYADGKMKMVRTYYPDSCVTEFYYHSGKLKRKDLDLPSPYRSELVWAYTAEYYENGRVKFTPTFIMTDGMEIINYYESGGKQLRKNWCGGMVYGKWEEWYENGTIKTEGQYAERDPEKKRQYVISKKVGTWKYYNEEGKLVKEEFYKDGSLVNTISY